MLTSSKNENSGIVGREQNLAVADSFNEKFYFKISQIIGVKSFHRYKIWPVPRQRVAEPPDKFHIDIRPFLQQFSWGWDFREIL